MVRGRPFLCPATVSSIRLCGPSADVATVSVTEFYLLSACRSSVSESTHYLLQGVYVLPLCVCLSLSRQDNSKSRRRIMMNFSLGQDV